MKVKLTDSVLALENCTIPNKISASIAGNIYRATRPKKFLGLYFVVETEMGIYTLPSDYIEIIEDDSFEAHRDRLINA